MHYFWKVELCEHLNQNKIYNIETVDPKKKKTNKKTPKQ